MNKACQMRSIVFPLYIQLLNKLRSNFLKSFTNKHGGKNTTNDSRISLDILNFKFFLKNSNQSFPIAYLKFCEILDKRTEQRTKIINWGIKYILHYK
ncbi:hypothetical protein BpHYR1_049799 [Brachionus plicatilis]|uniref:Uncharacterized protein n=1 Tax=Brachionus plicatilis TaxID=10195 RepID=A0A3M7RL71_BRAPC|nr:hypothetical protein BpHYR1_049799 [Brachionus plicatilis]